MLIVSPVSVISARTRSKGAARAHHTPREKGRDINSRVKHDNVFKEQ